MTQSTRRLLAALVTSSTCALGALTAPVPTTAAPASAAVAPGSVKVRVLQYNIRFGQYGIDRVARDIERTGAQVVMLNEIDDRRPSGGVHQAKRLGQLLGMSVVYDPNSRNRFGFRGNAVLTSLSVRSFRRIALPAPEGTEPRGLLKVRVSNGAVAFDVWSTHLNPGKGKLAQARTVRTTIGDPTCATVLGGDMNTTPGTSEYRVPKTHLRDLFDKAGSGDGGTGAGGKRIDYLFYDKVKPVKAKVLPRRHSDHHGLLGVVEIDPAKTC